ncbi:hypothetical protein HYZ05_00685 [Candidatus Daviesbacteria bacterium]|nr:hypothetical protein [Candidatus Daviesbacteria bacterium]
MSRSREFKPLSEDEICQKMTPDDLEHARSLIGYLAVEDGMTTEEASGLLARADELIVPLKEKSQVLAERRMARLALWQNVARKVVKSAIVLSVVGGTGWGGV